MKSAKVVLVAVALWACATAPDPEVLRLQEEIRMLEEWEVKRECDGAIAKLELCEPLLELILLKHSLTVTELEYRLDRSEEVFGVATPYRVSSCDSLIEDDAVVTFCSYEEIGTGRTVRARAR